MQDNLEIWEDIFKNNEWGKYPPISVIRFVARNFYSAKDRKDIKILELGAGTGANLWFCAREGFSVYGVEGSETASNIAKERFAKEGLEEYLIDMKVGDYYQRLNDFEDGFFDAIIDVESLYCNSFDKSREIIELAFRKLKDGGKMFSLTFADNTWGVEGEEVDYHAVIPESGPMSGKGFTRYTTKEDIKRLYLLENNEITNIERHEQHLQNGESIKEWVIELKKI